MKKRLTLIIGLLIAILPACSPAMTTTTQTVALSPIATSGTAPEATAAPTIPPTLTSIVTPEPTAVATEEPLPEETEGPESIPEYNIPGMKEAGITNQQYHMIDLLLEGIMSMAPYYQFQDTSKITPSQLYSFLIEELMAVELEYGEFPKDDDYNSLIDKAMVDKVICSAFGRDINVKFFGEDSNTLSYQNGIYIYTGVQGTVNSPHSLSVKRISKNRIQIDMDIIAEYDPGWIF